MSYLPSFKSVSATRTYDAGLFVLFGNTKNSFVESVTMGGGTAVTGPVKLAQRVLLRLLTPQEGYLYEPSEGSRFATDVRDYTLHTRADILASLSVSIDAIRDLFGKEQQLDPEIPLDEQLNDLRVDDVQVTSDMARIQLTLVTNAGSSYSFIAPIKLPS